MRPRPSGNLSATAIPSLALPFSIVGTFVVMYLLDYSLDNLSMMALILSIGFVVDDAIVMLENIVRHMEMGENPMVAALTGSREIGFTLVSMTLSLAAVFTRCCSWVEFWGGCSQQIKQFGTFCRRQQAREDKLSHHPGAASRMPVGNQ